MTSAALESEASLRDHRLLPGDQEHEQVQLDIYGEMLDCFFHAQRSLAAHGEEEFRVLALLLEHLEKIGASPTRDYGKRAAARSSLPIPR